MKHWMRSKNFGENNGPESESLLPDMRMELPSPMGKPELKLAELKMLELLKAGNLEVVVVQEGRREWRGGVPY